MRDISEIIIHCSATRPGWWEGKKTSAKVAEIKNWHTDPKPKGRSWRDIGYHFLIDRDGTLAKGRPIGKVGAHTLGHNTGSIGVCLFGGHGSSENDRFEDNFTLEQDKALRNFITDQKMQFPSIRKISGHNEYAAKACPGFAVADWFNSGVNASLATLIPVKNNPLPPAANARFEKFCDFLLQLAVESENRAVGSVIKSNMGISSEELAAWRKVSLSELDANALQFLAPSEAKQIYRARYYTACRCAEMPDRMAMVAFDAAAQFGDKEAVKLVQSTFNDLGMTIDGKPLTVDGQIGRLTMGAVQKTDPSVLADAFLDEVEAHLGEPRNATDVMSEGLARIAGLREFINTLPKGSGVRPSIQMKVSNNNFDISDILDIGGAAKSGDKGAALDRVAELILREKSGDSASRSRKKDLARLILGLNEADAVPAEDAAKITKGPDGEPPLTPINAALGTTVGRALNGKKSVTGIVGLLLTTLLPELGLNGDIVDLVQSKSSSLLTMFSLLTGWGFLGKIDKAVRLVGMLQGRK